MRRFPTGVAVVTVDVEGEQLGLTVGSLVSLSLEPPLVGIAIARQAALHELLRAGGRVRGQPARRRPGRAGPALRARRAADRALARDRDRPGRPRARRCSTARSAGSSAASRRSTPPATTRSSSARSLSTELGADGAAARPPRRRISRAVIEAVVFDLDGVLIDSEEVWDEVRERSSRERGGRYDEEVQRAMMGMSSAEWSRYMHEHVGVPDAAGGDQRRGRAADARRATARSCRSIDGAVEAVRRLAARWPLGLASSSNRPLIDPVLELAGLGRCFRATVSSEEVARGKPAPDVYLEAARRLGVAPRALRGDRGLPQRHRLGARGGDARRRGPEPELSARRRRARGGRRRARLDRRAHSRGGRGAGRLTGFLYFVTVTAGDGALRLPEESTARITYVAV